MNSTNFKTKIQKEANKVLSKDLIDNIKSKYILQKIFNNLKKKKLLYIIKYNKNIKSRININTTDYKEYKIIFDN